MFSNRMTQHLDAFDLEDQIPYSPAPVSSGFMLAPVGLATGTSQSQLLQWAYEKAQATTKPSWLERDVLGVWN